MTYPGFDPPAGFICRYRDCQRPAREGWTTCKRHYSAGMNRGQFQRIQAQRGYRRSKPAR